MLATSVSKRITIIIITIFVVYFVFRDQLWSLETPVFLQEPLGSFTISTTHITHTTPDDLTHLNNPSASTKEEIEISNLVRKLHQIAPPQLTEPAACPGKTVAIEAATIETERRDVTPVSDEKIQAARIAHENVVDMIRNSSHLVPYTPGSKGIVTVAGGKFTGALLVSIRMLRRTNSTLPVEVFMPNPEDYNKHTCEVVLPSLNARCVLIPQYEDLTIARYQYKIFAVLLSSFEDVLFLDADNFPIVDPIEWMEAKVYKDTGYVLWPDFWLATTSPHYFQVINIPAPSLLSIGTTESGEVIISKRTHSDVLLLALYYNIFGPSFYYPLLTQCDPGEGDKETWLYAAIALEKSYFQVRQRTGVVGHNSPDGYQTASMVQHNPSDDYSTYLQEEKKGEDHPLFRIDDPKHRPEVVFMHHNIIKLSPVEMMIWIGKAENKKSRMWGDRQSTIDRFKVDLEKKVWENVLWVACQWGDSLVNWDEGVCEGLMEHWAGVMSREAEEDVRKLFGVNKHTLGEENKEE
ncbi:74bfba49-9e62-4ca1-9fdd-22ac9a6975cd [Sclerotinia trifoliorum]|uniref:74bfba49-9e62-4ca1-9fdd-22ac9a6975cd n=1 Tax=Sclerotinia trifoliorum TaxID=28548 RepID=A0A8H2ZQY3_9HELO|nr:74bfba49-9e62-4ca1-9fdd-22ac9a6975cd [Sclerotinia trifoliorum]